MCSTAYKKWLLSGAKKGNVVLLLLFLFFIVSCDYDDRATTTSSSDSTADANLQCSGDNPLATDVATNVFSMTQIDTNGLPTGYISSIAVHPSNPSIVLVSYSTFGVKHLWKSCDGGNAWQSLDGSGDTGIPDIPVHTIFINPLNTAHIYIGTDLGVLYSADGGQNWESINMNGMANVVVEKLAYQASTRSLFAFTHGRGVFRVTLP